MNILFLSYFRGLVNNKEAKTVILDPKHSKVLRDSDYEIVDPNAAALIESLRAFGYDVPAAMRVSPVGFAFATLDEVLLEAKRTAEVTHNHPEGIKGAQAVAAAIFLARTGNSKDEIKQYVMEWFEYDLEEPLDEIRKYYTFDETCQGSVPQSIIAFLESDDFEDAVRKAVSIGGDSDTVACITGGIAQAFYGGVPGHIADEVLARLDDSLRSVVTSFMNKYCR